MSRSASSNHSKNLKACRACTSSKRRCTKRLPACQRCEARGLECVYESRSTIFIYQGQTQDDYSRNQVLSSRSQTTAAFAGALQLDVWPCPIGAPIGPSLNDLKSAWFLTPEAWHVAPLDFKVLVPVDHAVVEGYLNTAHGWLRQWAATGSNPFIHPKLYSQRMPTCVQDAFMAVPTYYSRTDATKGIVHRVLQEQANRLVASQSSTGPGDLLGEIGRVQALLVYCMIRLFDGDIRQRHLAECHLPILASWSESMREHATHAIRTDGLLLRNPLKKRSDDGEFTNIMSSPTPQSAEDLLWNAWILSETVRRTWYISMLLHNGYLLLKTGTVLCHGSIPVTTRKGVWQAKSASSWLKMCAEKSVGFANRHETENLISAGKANEVDVFTLALMELDFGSERIEKWKNDTK